MICLAVPLASALLLIAQAGDPATVTPQPPTQPPTQPTTQPTVGEVLEAGRREALAAAWASVERLREAPPLSIADLLDFRLENGFLLLSLDESLEAGSWRQPIEEFPDSVNDVRVRNPRENENAAPSFTVTLRRIGDAPNELIHYTSATVGPLAGQLILSRDTGTLAGDGNEQVLNVNLVQLPMAGTAEDAAVRLLVSGDTGGGDGEEEARERPLDIAADSFEALMREEPVAFHRYVSPMLDELGLEEIAHEQVRQAARQILLRDLPVEAEVEGRVRELLVELNADDAAVREAAEQALRELGRPGGTAVARLLDDPDTREALSAEQALRLRNVLAGLEPISPEVAATLAADPSFWRRVENLEGARGDEELVERAATRPATRPATGQSR